ncbi:MAG: hypothetical protein ACYDGM_03870 [Vulcanimicrobiaceae bacterium]
MPFLAVVHLRELRCKTCDALLAQAGARSFIIDEQDEPLWFVPDEVPEEMTLVMTCPSGHLEQLFVPNEIGAEETLLTPEDAPIGLDAVFVP